MYSTRPGKANAATAGTAISNAWSAQTRRGLSFARRRKRFVDRIESLFYIRFILKSSGVKTIPGASLQQMAICKSRSKFCRNQCRKVDEITNRQFIPGKKIQRFYFSNLCKIQNRYLQKLQIDTEGVTPIRSSSKNFSPLRLRGEAIIFIILCSIHFA